MRSPGACAVTVQRPSAALFSCAAETCAFTFPVVANRASSRTKRPYWAAASYGSNPEA